MQGFFRLKLMQESAGPLPSGAPSVSAAFDADHVELPD
jgi:hypothetical protein